MRIKIETSIEDAFMNKLSLEGSYPGVVCGFASTVATFADETWTEYSHHPQLQERLRSKQPFSGTFEVRKRKEGRCPVRSTATAS